MAVKLRAYNPVDVEIPGVGDDPGKTFQSVDLSHSQAEALEEVEEKIEKVSEQKKSDDTDLIPLIGEWFDIMLTGEGKPSELLQAKWDAEEVTPRQVFGLWFDTQAAIGEENKGPESDLIGAIDRPT